MVYTVVGRLPETGCRPCQLMLFVASCDADASVRGGGSGVPVMRGAHGPRCLEYAQSAFSAAHEVGFAGSSLVISTLGGAGVGESGAGISGAMIAGMFGLCVAISGSFSFSLSV